MFSFYKLYRVSKKVQTFEPFAAFCMDCELGAEIDVPPLTYEVRGNDLPQTVCFRQLIRAGYEGLECNLERDCIVPMDECYTVIPGHHTHHFDPGHERSKLSIHDRTKSVS